ncbi:transposase [Spirosoma linguale]|uniref:Transposase IS200-like domain-containing protein n=1 Tax=Spirosoma linguale (strain ATCC 33905 / DSM 74 / LMG 10896 / Claus 1) TaxID=504472 RepID=D2QMT6_SPILD|nr:hypothetical protein Slin_4519 [Spirosoma linguale DSM 74]
MDRFQNKFRTQSTRADWWDYGWAGAYFITICTAERQHFFGEIHEGKLQLSNIGILADVFWHEIRRHAQQVELGTFVVMPNHVHGILILNEPGNIANDTGNVGNVETRHALSLRYHNNNQNPPVNNDFRTRGRIQFRLLLDRINRRLANTPIG